ncbi:sigma-54-dependent Fis family transcriptional regulator [candidate division KSB3 bacterium]|uniref:Sigma-54-dependent Fis family transcriptional regulator n=1 Tax=candidate division KSB3 bacterium TaxID=2044937 RepID=A0A2G6E3F2_9BACT|nr:MAG: sigma-54-dependent Fis family transcriptional regulator [candidate division KSB3 bacterium]PIE28851.1 MAG: sigma-54-dependent Fis family transcriptional regulator [candidate division KSB3 bacterium]
MKILIIDDEKILRDTIVRFFSLEPDLEVKAAGNAFSAQRMIAEESFDIVVTDLDMPDMSGLELLEWLREEKPLLPVLMMSGYGQIQDAVEAMKFGACDYMVKPLAPKDLLTRIRHIAATRRLHAQVERGRFAEELSQDLLGDSPAMRKIKATLAQVAPTPATVLITGESGTGKEVVARSIHRLSPRKHKRFTVINLGAVQENLLESELFGHEKGAFTGASFKKAGLFEEASSGTLFLDEIGEMPLHLQVKLLRVLQEREVQPVGSTTSFPIDVRILAATNADLVERIQKGLFREDLFYRLNIVQITVPPLRDRREDIPLLAGHFLQKCNRTMGKTVNTIDADALQSLQSYAFPGNIRELENIIERAFIFAETERIRLKDLALSSESSTTKQMKAGTLEEAQKQVIITTLRRWEGNRSKAARELGIDRKTLVNKIKSYGLTDI